MVHGLNIEKGENINITIDILTFIIRMTALSFLLCFSFFFPMDFIGGNYL